jgi:prepilin-type N-terminal cleavage/methylation domain-containing protein
VSLRARLAREESGFTLVEMLVTLAILGIVLGSLTLLLVSATNSEANQNQRFQAQEQGRLALDALRHDVHCAGSATSPGGVFPATQISITLGSQCATSGGAPATILWCTSGAASRYSLIRTTAVTCTGGVKEADYLTIGNVFTGLTPAGSGLKAKLSVDLPVDVNPAAAGGLYELKDDLVLRNTSR